MLLHPCESNLTRCKSLGGAYTPICVRNIYATSNSSSGASMGSRLGQPTPQTHPHLLAEGQITPGANLQEYQTRRSRLIENLPSGALVLLPAAKHHYMSNDIPYEYRQNTDFAYMCGVQEPGTLMALYRDEKGKVIFHLFMRPRSEHSELWDGPRTGVERANDFFGSDAASSADDWAKIVKELAKTKSHIFLRDIETDVAEFGPMMREILEEAKKEGRAIQKTELKGIMCQMRLVKTAAEVEIMRASCKISAHAFADVMAITTPTMREHDLWANIDFACRRRGAQRLAYPPVVASGISCNTLHYVMNDSVVKDGDLILMDAGGEFFNYSSDITRTWPSNGKFTKGQKIVYEAVLRTQKKVIEASTVYASQSKDGSADSKEPNSLARLQQIASDSLGQELFDMGIEDPKYLAKCYPHMIGHFLGMDVHDVPAIGYHVPFRPGMIITVEPGLYMPNEEWVPEHLRGIGVRIEDDVLITADGPEVLTHEAPKEVDDLEKIIGARPWLL